MICSKTKTPDANILVKSTHRIYICLRCKDIIRICSNCDRGNIYCNICSAIAKKERKKRANEAYRISRNGLLVRAALEKKRRERLRKEKIMGDRGSIFAHSKEISSAPEQGAQEESVIFLGEPNEASFSVQIDRTCQESCFEKRIYCSFCGKECSKFSRRLGTAAQTLRLLRRRQKKRGSRE